MKTRIRKKKSFLKTALVMGVMLAFSVKGQIAYAEQCGDLTVTGGQKDTDYTYDATTGLLTVKTDVSLTIGGESERDHIYIEKDVNANLTLEHLQLQLFDPKNETAGIAIADGSAGNVTLNITGGDNYIYTQGYPAIQKNGDKNSSPGWLTIQGTGHLDAETSRSENEATQFFPATIGGGHQKDAANIRFVSGTYEIIQFSGGAAIGGGYKGNGTNIVIDGGTIEAYIQKLANYNHSYGYGAVIGGGYEGNGENIEINDGNIKLYCKKSAQNNDTEIPRMGAGIGGGVCSTPTTEAGAGKNIVINGGVIDVTTIWNSAGIGAGANNCGGNSITINGGYITAKAADAAAIGGAYGNESSNYIKDTITITGGTIAASVTGQAAGIGIGRAGFVDVYISGGSVQASGGTYSDGSQGTYKADAIGLSGRANCNNEKYGGKFTSTLTYSSKDPSPVSLREYTCKTTGSDVRLIMKNSDGTPYDYGMKNLRPDSSGKLYLYLKDGVEISGEDTGNEYSCKFNVAVNLNNAPWAQARTVTMQSAEGKSYTATTDDNTNYVFEGKYEAGTYSILVGGTDTGQKIKVDGGAIGDQSVDYYTLKASGIENGSINFNYLSYTATALKNKSHQFLVYADTGYKISKVTYKIGATGQEKELTSTNAVYTIPEGEITDTVTISAIFVDAKGQPVDFSKVSWDYNGPYYYKNTPYTVQLNTKPEGIKNITYKDNTATAIGNYTATAEFETEEGYYVKDADKAALGTLKWEIKEYDAFPKISLKYNGQSEKQEWYNTEVTVEAEGDYQIAESAAASQFKDSIVFTESGNKQLYFKDTNTGYIKATGTEVSIRIDKILPNGSISIDGKDYEDLNTQKAIQKYHLKDGTISVNGNDGTDGSGIDSIEYVLLDQWVDEGELDAASWTTVDSSKALVLPDNQNQAVYARITDKAGNIRYISTPVLYNDTVPPEVSLKAISVKATSVKVSLAMNEPANYAYVLLQDGEKAPESLEAIRTLVDEGKKGGKGSKTENFTGDIDGLQPNGKYVLYAAADDGRTDLGETGNANESQVFKQEVTTSKKELSIAGQECMVKAGQQVKVDIKQLLQTAGMEDDGSVEYEISDWNTGNVISQKPNMDNGVLTAATNTNLEEGASQNITVTVHSDVYEDISVVITIRITAKNPLTLSGIAPKNDVYNGTSQQGYTGTPVWKDEDGNEVSVEGMQIQYAGRGDTNYNQTAVPPVDAGEYSVTFSVPESNADYIGNQTYNFEIEKAKVDMDGLKWVYEHDGEVKEYLPSSQLQEDGKEYIFSLSGCPEDLVEIAYDGTSSAISAGEYTVIAKFTLLNNNYDKPASISCTWEIQEREAEHTKIKPDMSKVSWYYIHNGERSPFEPKSGEYALELEWDGEEYILSVDNLPDGVVPSYTGERAIEVGGYTAEVTFKVTDSQKYEAPASMSLKWKIAAKPSIEDPNQGGSNEDPDENQGQDKPDLNQGQNNHDKDPGKNGDKEQNEKKDSDYPAVGTTESYQGQKFTVKTSSGQGGTVEFAGSSNKNVKSITIPSSIQIDKKNYKVQSIKAGAFKNCKKLKKVTIKANVKEIPSNAFNGCSKLTSVTLCNSVTKIGNKAFYKCTSLTKITIPKNVTSIGSQAFYGDKKLKTVTIKTKKLKKVGSKAIKGIYKKAVIKCPSKKLVKKYKKLFKKSTGFTSKMKIK